MGEDGLYRDQSLGVGLGFMLSPTKSTYLHFTHTRDNNIITSNSFLRQLSDNNSSIVYSGINDSKLSVHIYV